MKRLFTHYFLFLIIFSSIEFSFFNHSLAAEKERAGKAKGARNGPQPTYADVKYGVSDKDTLDFWKAKSDKPTPVIVFIHGGGFVGGDKTNGWGSPVQSKCLSSGISYASINYRFLKEVTMQTILHDCGRAVQFLRSKSTEWNIDKDRFGCCGGSAGAGASLWIGCHDDLANPNSSDPIEHESSRILVVGAGATQSTYDITRWKEVLGIPQTNVEQYYPSALWLQFYGAKSMDELMNAPESQKVRADCDMLAMLDKEDAPVYLHGGHPEVSGGKVDSMGQLQHSYTHAKAVKSQCDKIGLECILGPQEGGDDGMITFMFKHLKEPLKEKAPTAPAIETPSNTPASSPEN
jgi:hypothetical protein